MADFTIWRFHECSAKFNQNFLSDKKRLVFWLAAFFLIFWNKSPSGGSLEIALFGLASASGAAVLLVLTAVLANRLFGREVELLAGWILLTSPGFLWFGHFGFIQPAGAALTLLAILYALDCGKFTFFSALVLGALCSFAGFLSGIPGLLLPLAAAALLRTDRWFRPAVFAGLACGLAIAAFPLLYVPFRTGTGSCLGFGWRVPLYTWARFLFRPESVGAFNGRLGLLLTAAAPWLWIAAPALGALHERLKLDRRTGGRLTGAVVAVALGIFFFWRTFGFAAVLPFFAILCAWALTTVKVNFPPAETVFRVMLRIYDGAQYLFAIGCLAMPYLFIHFLAVPGHEYSYAEAGIFYFRIPGAGLAVLIWNLLLLARKRRKVWLAPDFPVLDRLIPAIFFAMLILQD